MNSHYSLETTLRDILQVVNPTEDDWSKRFQVINDLQAVVQTMEILRGATVEPFGSFVSNLFTRWGDLDISIELPNGSYISSTGKKFKQTLLLDVVKALRNKGGFHGIRYISHARVPILKCDSNKDNISCDISINNLSGQMKSKLLFRLNDIDARFRDMVLIVKEWAKAHGINDPKTGTLNSYSLSLLVIFHFQTCEPAILPALSEIYPGNMAGDLTGVRAVAEKNIQEICGLNLDRIKSDRSRPINRSSLSDLFLSFLAKFCDIGLRAETQGISPHNGQWEDIDTNMIWQPKTYALFIEDPFEQPMNCARAVSQRNLKKIARAFQSSHEKLTAVNQQHPLAVLVRPEVLSIMSRSQVAAGSGPIRGRIHPHAHRNPVGPSPSRPHLQSVNGGQHHNRNGYSQANRGAHAPTQVQNSPNKRVSHLKGSQSQIERNGDNGVNQRPIMHGSQSQSQSQIERNGSNGVSQRPNLQGSQSQSQIERNGVNQRPTLQGSQSQRPPGQSSQKQQVQQKWRPKT